MSYRFAVIVVACLVVSQFAWADEAKQVSGRVFDQDGQPAVGASVAATWSANGLRWDQVTAVKDRESAELWRNEGKMEAWGNVQTIADAEGRFSIPAPERKKTLMVYDRERRHGAVVVFDTSHPEVPVEVRLKPLVRVFGINRFAGSEQPSKWTCTYLCFPYEESDPLNRARMAICGSYQVRFEFQVPPGTYEISATGDEPRTTTLEDRKFTVTADQKELDLGSLVLRPQIGIQERIDRAKAKGNWGDYKQNLGKEPPPWHLTDAKGVGKDAKLADFKGKWTLLYFWGPNCPSCLSKDLPVRRH